LNYDYVINCWDCINRTVSKKIEEDIKRYCKVNKINTNYGKETEIIKTNNIDEYVKIFKGYVIKRVGEYENKFTDKRLEQKIKLIEKIEELKKNQEINASFPDILKFAEIEEEDLQLPTQKEVPKVVKDFDNSVAHCKHCSKDKKVEEFGINKMTNDYFKKCLECRLKCRVSDKKRRTKHKEENKDAEILHPQKKEYYYANHDEIRDKQDKHYEKNKSEIINQKKSYRNKRIEEANNDPNKSYCRKCNTIKTNDQFGINKGTNSQYKQCTLCRTK
jgi:hypothetical protein